MYYIRYFYFVDNFSSHAVDYYNSIDVCKLRAVQVYHDYLKLLKSRFEHQLNHDCMMIPVIKSSAISNYHSDDNTCSFMYDIGQMPHHGDVEGSRCRPDGEAETTDESFYTSSEEEEDTMSQPTASSLVGMQPMDLN